MSRLLYFPSSSICLWPRKAVKDGIGPCTHVGDTHGFCIPMGSFLTFAVIWKVKQWVGGRFLSVSPSLCRPAFPIKINEYLKKKTVLFLLFSPLYGTPWIWELSNAKIVKLSVKGLIVNIVGFVVHRFLLQLPSQLCLYVEKVARHNTQMNIHGRIPVKSHS